jgi:hypothetical protein
MAYDPSVPPVLWTTSGFIVLSVPPGLSSALNNSPGSGGSSGGNMPTSFNISGFGPSSLTIGNSTGYPSLNPSGGAGSSNVGGGGGGGGGGGSNSSPTPNPSNNSAFGGAFSSGYNTSLDSSNKYGMSTSPVGSIPLQTYTYHSEEVPPLPQDSSGALTLPNQSGGIMGAPTSGPGIGVQGPLWNNLLGKPARKTPQPSGSVNP